MSSHIALLGKTIEPVLKGFQHYGAIDNLYILHSKDEPDFKFKKLAEELRTRLSGIGFDNTHLVQIDPFKMDDIIGAILQIVGEASSPIYINITGGTNLMAGAACIAAFFVGAQAYYVLGKRGGPISESRVVELPVPNIPYNKVLDDTQIAILREIQQLNRPTTNRELREILGLSPQRMRYHINELETKRLIFTSRGFEQINHLSKERRVKKLDKRLLTVNISNAGKFVLNFTGNSTRSTFSF